MNNRLLQVLSVRPFFFLWLAEIFSQVAMNMINFILIIVAFELTQSNTAVSGIVLSYTIPAIFFGITAGALVDRWSKKKVLLLTNVSRVILLILLAFLHQNIMFVYILSFTIAIANQFFIPAETPMIPLVVKKDLLFSANAFFGMAIYASLLIAYALSGPFLVFYGKTNVFFILGIFFALAALFVSFVVLPKTAKKEKKSIDTIAPSLSGELHEAYKLISKTSSLSHSIFLLTFSQTLILILAVIGPGYATKILHINVDVFPLFFVTPAAVGMVIGAAFIAHFFHTYSKVKLANMGLFISAVAMLIMPYVSNLAQSNTLASYNTLIPQFLSLNTLHFMIGLAFVLGVANALVFVPSNTIIQEETSDEIRGKIYGALNTVSGLFSLVPVVIAGSLADIAGVGNVLTIIGGCIVVILFYRLVSQKK